MSLTEAREILLRQLNLECWAALAYFRGLPTPEVDFERRLFLDTLLCEHVRAEELRRRIRERMS